MFCITQRQDNFAKNSHQSHERLVQTDETHPARKSTHLWGKCCCATVAATLPVTPEWWLPSWDSAYAASDVSSFTSLPPALVGGGAVPSSDAVIASMVLCCCGAPGVKFPNFPWAVISTPKFLGILYSNGLFDQKHMLEQISQLFGVYIYPIFREWLRMTSMLRIHTSL